MTLAVHNYHSANDCLPAAYLPDRFGRPNDSWRMAILPFLEGTTLYNNVNFNVSWDASENGTVRSTRVSTFLRPEDPKDGPPIAKFLAVVGPTTAFPGPVNLRFDDLRDGMAHTLMFGEVAESDIGWAEPRDLAFSRMHFQINRRPRKLGFGSPYGGARLAMMDGSVVSFTEAASPALIRALVTATGGETIAAGGVPEHSGPNWRVVEDGPP